MLVVLHDARRSWVASLLFLHLLLEASKDKSDDGSGSDDADEDDGANSPSDDEMST